MTTKNIIGQETIEVLSSNVLSTRFESLDPMVIPSSTRWGDFGYTQVCVNGKEGTNLYEIAAYFEKEGMEFLSGSQLMHDEKGGGFFYLKDPDGIPVEFLVFNQ